MWYRVLYWLVVGVATAVILAVMVFAYTSHLKSVRAQQAWQLVVHARMTLSIPDVDASSPEAKKLLFGGHSPQEAIDLCTEAISLSPEYKDAYEVRAAAYERVGDSDLAKQDRATASRLQ